MNARRVVITGFMAAGKTTVARALGRALSVRALDLDDLVEEREGRNAQRLIDEDGETFFRDAETRALEAVLRDERVRIIATGGGAWTLARNRALIQEHGCLSVWLDAPFDLCWQRTRAQDNQRPFARDEAKARELYERRRDSYALASLRIKVGKDSTPERLAREIEHALLHMG